MSTTPPAGDGPWRALAPRTLARLLRTYGGSQFDLCEAAVQEALLDAYVRWPSAPPDDPQAWLTAAARRRYVDRVRSERRRREREDRVALLDAPLSHEGAHSDDTLLLLQLSCHPALPRSGQVALTLRAVAGLTTAQIANAYQLPEATIAQRITRAKRRVATLGAFPQPAGAEAHHTTSGAPAHDADLATEAIRVTRMLYAAAPGSREAAGLLALMLLTEARHPARVGPRGQLIPLDEQDRSRWDRGAVEEGLALLDAVVPGADPGPYLLQACIAGVHAQAADTGSTDWDEIHALYVVLEHTTGHRNPMVSLNRIVAHSMVHGPDEGLALLDELAAAHPRLARVDAVRAHLLERVGHIDAAADAYRRAIAATVNVAEQHHLRDRLRRLGA